MEKKRSMITPIAIGLDMLDIPGKRLIRWPDAIKETVQRGRVGGNADELEMHGIL